MTALVEVAAYVPQRRASRSPWCLCLKTGDIPAARCRLYRLRRARSIAPASVRLLAAGIAEVESR
jgi:hypothetical protein